MNGDQFQEGGGESPSTDPRKQAGSTGAPVAFMPNEFPAFDTYVAGVGVVTVNGMDAEVLADIKAVGAWPAFARQMKIGRTCSAQFYPRAGGRVSLFLFVGVATQGGFISMIAPDSLRAREVMMRMALPFLGYPIGREALP